MMKRIAQAWALAAIVLLPNYIDLTSGDGDARMRVATPLTRIALAHLTDMAIVTGLFAGAIALLRKAPWWPRLRWAWIGLLPPLLFIRNLNLIPFHVPAAVIGAASAVWIGLLVLLGLRFPQAAPGLGRAGSALLAGFACFALVMTAQLVRATVWRPGPQAFAAPIPAPTATKPRLVWILFDELAYQQTFGSRDPSLHLPNFDRLRAESTLYTHVTPIAYRTTRAAPSLLLGRMVTNVAYAADNRYWVETRRDPHWARFDAGASLFGLAKREGVTTAIVGWYIAYCPVFAGLVTQCYWSNDDAQDRGPTSLDASYGEDVWFPLRMLAEQAFAPERAWADDARWGAEGHIASVKDLSWHAMKTLATSNADLIFLHLPTPHPPAFWNRRIAEFAIGGSYLDSLDYTDRLLGRMLTVLEAQPRWAATTLLVQGDHAWRTPMWRPLPGWSAEDERVSHGGAWDPRPVLMIHAAGQQAPHTVGAPTSLMYVHDFVAQQIQLLGGFKKSDLRNERPGRW